MEEAINAAKVNERAVIGDVLDDAFADITFSQLTNDLSTLLGTALFENGATGHNDVATWAVHFEDCERLNLIHQRCNVADRADIHLRARKEGIHAAEVDSETTFDAANNGTVCRLFFFVKFFEAGPGFFAAGFVARENGFAECVFDTLEIDFDDFTGFRVIFVRTEFAKRDATFGFQADVDDDSVIFDGDNSSRNNTAFLHLASSKAGFKHGRKIVRSRVHCISRHSYSKYHSLLASRLFPAVN